MPMAAKEGMAAIPSMPAPIRPKESSIAGFRPTRSAIRPITSAPSGRVRNPAPKVASVARRLVAGSCEGKKVRPICTAK